MKGKLVCLIGLALGGIIGTIFTGRKLRKLEQEQDTIDTKLNELHREEENLLKELERYRQITDEEIQKTKELIEQINELGIDPMMIDVRIDSED